MDFGERLIQIRKEKKMPQNELAKKIGIHANVLGRYEREEVKPSIQVAVQIAEALGVSLDFLAGKTDLQIDQDITNTILTIQKLPETDREGIMFALNGLIRDAKARNAYQ